MRDLLSHFQEQIAAWSRGREPGETSAAITLVETAEELLRRAPEVQVKSVLWHSYLDLTRHPRFLTALPDHGWRWRWADTTFAAITSSSYTLETMMAQRVDGAPDLILFQELTGGGAGSWSYAQVSRRVKAIAALFLDAGTAADDPSGGGASPSRVAILAENSLGSACCDLACLLHDIFVTPLNIHFKGDTLAWICDRVDIDTVVTDTAERLARLMEIRGRVRRPFRIYLLDEVTGSKDAGAVLLEEMCARLTPEEVTRRLAVRTRLGPNDTATVMFTSGSTGTPKGVAFSQYNLITKRFGRAAALPAVGEREVLLCYLPLYHTFGRYLEMLGSVFWGGTYVFAGNPSAETLLAQLRQVRPTALISVPLRWLQIWEHCLERREEVSSPAEREGVFRKVVGERLAWGLSAAGYLDPKVFRFFHRHGVALCSGFGMTEATGGITMTPPDDYREGSVGIPLPGVAIRFGEQGELQISGPYIARYLDPEPDDATAEATVPGAPATDEYWLATGDLFQQHEDGHLAIVDRIKDIYKNSKGQTIAPRKVESKFAEVPGIKRAFLAGDGRAYNTLLIVPEWEDPVLKSAPSPDNIQVYFHQIVAAANRDLAPSERVVNFALLERDFSLEQGELTPKGSYRRKTIEQNFASVIQELYQRTRMELRWQELTIIIPRWFYRDSGILETDIKTTAAGLRNQQTHQLLTVSYDSERQTVRLGDLEYQLKGRMLDLGTFTLQPLLWAGNPALAAFCPVKEGWDAPLGPVSEQVFLPKQVDPAAAERELPAIKNQPLATVHLLAQRALFGPVTDAQAAVASLATRLRVAGDRLGNLIRRRLEALARHQERDIRCRAYQILVLDEPTPDYHRFLPAFIQSGLPFLSDESITAIASQAIEPRRLQAFRQRLEAYRNLLTWPAPDRTRQVFDDIFHLLADFARYHPAFYAPIREELVSWILHEDDPELARQARRHFDELAAWFERKLTAESPDDATAWADKIVYQDGLSPTEISRLEEVLVGTTFLQQSVLLANAEESFTLADVPPSGIWISRILSWHDYSRYRVSINTAAGKHFDLQLIIREDLDRDWVMETIYWLIAIHGYPHGPPVLPRFGCCRPELGALSLAYSSDLTVWEKVREFSSVRGPGTSLPNRDTWRKLFVRALATVIAGWRNSGRNIVPGMIGPSNVIVPEPDFREGARIQSLTGWHAYEGPLSLIKPLLHNFYRQTISHYPWCRDELDREWILDACVEALGVKPATAFLGDLREALAAGAQLAGWPECADCVDRYLERLRERYYVPLPLQGAMDRYTTWARINAQATAIARLEILAELSRLYRLDRQPEIARYTLFRHTYFAQTIPSVLDTFDRLLTQLFRQPERPATQLVELSDLQASLTDLDDRRAFRRLAFPRAEAAQELELLTVGEHDQEHVIVRSQVSDRHGVTYQVREPTEAAEVGQLYRLFLLAGFPKTISGRDRFFIATDEQEQIIGGVCYKVLDEEVVHLDGIVVARSLLDRGLTSALLEDFCTRLADGGCRAVRTHFFLRSFYQRRGFRTDSRWGGLVRFLDR